MNYDETYDLDTFHQLQNTKDFFHRIVNDAFLDLDYNDFFEDEEE